MRRESLSKIRLSEDEKQKMCEEIAAFYLDEYDEEMKNWYGRQQENMESDFYMLYKDVR